MKRILLSPGQTDRKVVASGPKLNLGRDLCWVAKRTSKFPRKYTQVAKKRKKFKADYPRYVPCSGAGRVSIN